MMQEQSEAKQARDQIEPEQEREEDEMKQASLQPLEAINPEVQAALQLVQRQHRAQQTRRRVVNQAPRTSSRRRTPFARSWSAMVAYTGAAGRRTVFHKATCKFVEVLSGRAWKYCTRVQANGFGMRPATGCQFSCIEGAEN